MDIMKVVRMKTTNLIIGLALMLILAVGTASAVDDKCLPDDGTYCGTLQGTYSPDVDENDPLYNAVFNLKADVQANLAKNIIVITNIDTSGSYPAIDDNLDVVAVYDENSEQIFVYAQGTCNMENSEMKYPFYGQMTLDACDFSIVNSSGHVNIPESSTTHRQIDLSGDFTFNITDCCQEIPDGTYCGTLMGTYTPDVSSQHPLYGAIFNLKADVEADFDSKIIRITNIDTSGSYPEIDGVLNVIAIYDEDTRMIKVIATGTCGMGYPFYGEMLIDACDFSVVSNSGHVMTDEKINLLGDFTFKIVPCNGGEQEIPEFPTVALPMIAVLGLAFFIQRRKE